MPVNTEDFQGVAAELRDLARWAFEEAAKDASRKRALLRLRRRLLQEAIEVERIADGQEASA